MRILVTGGCGYIGTLLTGKLLAQGHHVTVVDVIWFGNYLNDQAHLTIIKEDIRKTDSIFLEGFDAIIHLASIANDPCVELDAKLSWEVNVLATMKLADKAVRHGVKQFIYASSGSVYGVKEEPAVVEDMILTPISEYNKTKMVAERVLMSYKDEMIIQCVRPATVCGFSPRMRLDVSVNMLTMQALMNRRITVFGGTQVRPNIHIDDMVEVYLLMLDLGKKAEGVYNAGFENLSIMDIAKKITEYVPADIEVVNSNDPRSYRLSSEKLLALDFRPTKGVDDAIKEIVAAYKQGAIKNNEQCYNVKWMKKKIVN